MMMLKVETQREEFTRVCRIDDVLPDTGVCCLVGHEQVAVFRIGVGSDFRALGNFDPFSRANVLSRGLVGDRAGRVKVSSPMYKQSFCVETGICLDDPNVSVPTYEVRVVTGYVELRTRATERSRTGNMGLLSEVQGG